MHAKHRTRRPYGTGSVYIRAGNWWGRWWSGGRRVKRKLGPARPPGTREGLTRGQAERELRRRMEQDVPAAPGVRLTVEEAGERYLHHLEHVVGRKPSTLGDYRGMVRRHLVPHFGETPLARITPDQVRAFLQAQARVGAARQSKLNRLNFLSGLFGFAIKRGWAHANPVAAVDKPRAEGRDPDIRFLELEEVEALLRAVPADGFGPTDRALYLTAALTGLRQGELLALRWRDVDWTAGRVRVRRNLVRGQYGTPKSRRSSRAVPLADRVAVELERHFQRSAYQHDDDLVFPHPGTGNPLDPTRVTRRFYGVMRAAGLGERCGGAGGITFHSLRHTFGTQMAAAGVPMRTLQEYMGHRDFATSLVYTDYAPDADREAEFVDRAFGRGPNLGPKLSESERNSEHLNRSSKPDSS